MIFKYVFSWLNLHREYEIGQANFDSFNRLPNADETYKGQLPIGSNELNDITTKLNVANNGKLNFPNDNAFGFILSFKEKFLQLINYVHPKFAFELNVTA